MLRDDRQLALQAAIEACLHAAHVHEDGAALLGAAPSGLGRLAEQRRQDAETLAEHIRRLGDLPPEPDPEYEVAADVISHVRAALSEDQRQAAIARSNEAEEALATALREVLRQELTRECREDVGRILGSREQLA